MGAGAAGAAAAAGAVASNNAAAAARRKRAEERRRMGYSHQHRCPVCSVIVGKARCFCDAYHCLESDKDEDHPIGEPRYCSEHFPWYAPVIVLTVIIGIVGLVVWWLTA